MTKPLPWSGRIALLLLLPAALLPMLFAGQRSSAPVSTTLVRQSRFHDWTTHYAVYSQTGTLAALEAARSDPRALFRWREVQQREAQPRETRWLELQPRQLRSFLAFPHRPGPGHFPHRGASDIHADWSISLGTGATAAGQFPAKFTFDTTATVTAPASCTNDFVVYPVSVAGSAAQPNIVAFNNLYSGTAGGNGICNRATPVNDDGVSATVLWSYNVNKVAGAVTTSPVLSLDGAKVAFVESVAGSAAHFHVLAWKSGDGKATNAQNVLVPKAIASFTDPIAPSAGTGTSSDLALGATATGTDTLSSPFVDYVRDQAYVGNDIGVLYRIRNVFCTAPACGGASPGLDPTWGTSGAVTTGCSGKLTGPVLDFVTLDVYVGCSDGKVYGFKSTGAALSTASIAVGNGSATGGVVESPIVDGVNGFIYAVSGTGAAPNTANAVLVQAQTNLSAPRVALVGVSGFRNLHAPAFNDPYFSNATSTTWLIYTGAFDATAANLTLYGSTFDASRNMAIGAPANSFNIGTRPEEYAPLTEFNNTNDWLFIGILIAPPNFARSNINSFPAVAPAQPTVANRLPDTSTGTSGMVVDNSSASVQASSLYFASLGSNTAHKYTQAGLQ